MVRLAVVASSVIGAVMARRAAVIAQEPHPTLTCDTRASAAGGARTPSVRFAGSLPPSDTVKVVVAWMTDSAGGSVQRVRVASTADSLGIQCASRRRLQIELRGPWRRDSVVVQVFGAAAVELESHGRTVVLAAPAAEPRRAGSRTTPCTLSTIVGRLRFACSGPQPAPS